MQSFNAAIKYVHEEEVHNLQSPGIIVPYLVEKFKPASVIDVGCGIGTFLRVFKEYGVKEILGVDGKWVNKTQLYIGQEEFLEANLEETIKTAACEIFLTQCYLVLITVLVLDVDLLLSILCSFSSLSDFWAFWAFSF